MTRRQVVQAVVAVLLLALAAVVGSALRTDRTTPRTIAWGGEGATSMVVIGAPGLSAADVDPTLTPALWALLRDGSSASLNVTAVRATACPVDGWLSLSAGGRAGQPDSADGGCGPLPAVTGGRVDGWSAYAAAATARPYGTTPGLLATVASARGQCVSAIGPGAALAAADPSGVVRDAQPFAEPTLTSGLVACSTAIVDAGSVSGRGEERRRAAVAVDARVAEVVAAAPTGADLLVAGLADDGTQGIRLLIASGPNIGPGTLWSPSTHQPGIAQLGDVSATVVAHLGGVAPESFGGAPLERAPAPSNADALARARRGALLDEAEASRAVTPVVAPFFITWGALVLGSLALLALVWWRRLGSDRLRDRLRSGVRQGLVVAAAVPVATFLANLVPWWRVAWTGAALVVDVLVWTAVVSGLALRGAWRRTVTGPPTAVALATLVVLVADVVDGSRLQISSLLGLNPVVGGRFYGVGNVTFALVAAALFVVAITLALRVADRFGPRGAAAAVLLLGLVTLAVDAAPMWGADAGGPPALVPGLAVLALAVLGVRLTWRRVLGVGGVTLVIVVGIALLDWARGPASRSHLGRFVQTVIDGGGADVVVRKLAQNLETLTGTSVFAYLMPVGLVVFWWALVRPRSALGRPLTPLCDAVPPMRPGLVGLMVTATVGLLLNDTGVAIPPVIWLLAGPLVAAAALRESELRPRGDRVLSRRERWHS